MCDDIAMPSLTPEERESIGRHLAETAEGFLQSIQGLSPAQWSFKPGDDIWSIAECADHVVAVEKMIFQMVSRKMQERPPDLERAEATRGKERLISRAVPDRSTRVKVPVQIEATGHNSSPQDLGSYFQEIRDQTLAYVRETPDPVHDRCMPHFMFKDLDGAQWLRMISLHTERHTAQINEVKSAAGYPA
jgi:hypothetical protein